MITRLVILYQLDFLAYEGFGSFIEVIIFVNINALTLEDPFLDFTEIWDLHFLNSFVLGKHSVDGYFLTGF